jgi:Transcriptional regulatory protein, C terminal
VFTKHDLLRDIWGYRTEARTSTLDAYACRLRKKLKQAGAVDYVVNIELTGVSGRYFDGQGEAVADGQAYDRGPPARLAPVSRELTDAALGRSHRTP